MIVNFKAYPFWVWEEEGGRLAFPTLPSSTSNTDSAMSEAQRRFIDSATTRSVGDSATVAEELNRAGYGREGAFMNLSGARPRL